MAGMLDVLLAQLPVPNNPATNLPLAAGYLTAYAHARGLLDRVAITILPRALADTAGDAALVAAIVAQAPAILGFSLYTWNSERSLAIAERVRAQLPEILIIAGGPEVQHANHWVLRHPGLDIAVVGEGEQTFAALLEALLAEPTLRGAGQHALRVQRLAEIPGIVLRDQHGLQHATAERVALEQLADLPSPYLLGLLELRPGDMLMIEVSRWCPYSCSFCLYGRNMGPRLGGRYFPTERLLAEIAWGRARGATSIHFIEANLNLVPPFQALMRGLADLNADRALALYAELRGEHLTEEAVTALVQAGLKVAEVGLQTANPVALRAAQRRTDLQKWAAGTRRLYAAGVEVLLDVIVGLPADNEAGVAETLAFIEREQLGAYDAFTLQVLPGTAMQRESAAHGLIAQNRPPYYVLATDRLSYADLRRLRSELKQRAGLDPDLIEGCPPPRLTALAESIESDGGGSTEPGGLPTTLVAHWDVRAGLAGTPAFSALAAHVDLLAAISQVRQAAFDAWLIQAQSANPTTLFDLYLFGAPPAATELQAWRDALPYQPGYLDRVAIYRRMQPNPQHLRVSPRIWLVLPWTAQIDPQEYAGIAEVIWEYWLAADEIPPLRAWERAGGAGIWLRGATQIQRDSVRAQVSCLIWGN